MFALSKWYLDLVTADGVALVAYSARLRWGVVRLPYASLLCSRPGREPDETATVRPGGLPRVVGDRLHWRHRPLRIGGEWIRETPPIEVTLLRTAAGRLRWHCVMPRARAAAEWGEEAVAGRGYAERLELTIPPHRLPFRTLRWGRHLSDSHALVWIDLAGECRAWLDGTERPGAHLSALGMELGDHLTLELFESRTIRHRAVAAGIGRVAPMLRKRLGPLAGMREHKLLSRSSLMRGTHPVDVGWTIHEEVIW